MLRANTSSLRDWGLFVLIALLPSVAIGVLGLRALANEEAAIKREMQAMLEQNAKFAHRDYEAALAELTVGAGGQPAFVDALIIDSDTASAKRTEAGSTDVPTSESAEKCAELARDVRKEEAREALLAGCEGIKTAGGRHLWIVMALSAESTVSRARIEAWLRTYGPALGGAERAATRLDIQRATWLDEADRAVLATMLTGGPHALAPMQGRVPPAQRYAMRTGRPRISWDEPTTRGLLLRQTDGGYRGFVIHPASLSRALDRGWPDLPTDVAARLVLGTAPRGASFEVLSGGGYIQIDHRVPGVVEARTQQSRRILLGVASFFVLVAVGLAALLFARIRSERRVSALRTDFVAAVSHELRTPIASLRMLSELLADGSIEDADEQAEMHHALAKESKRLGETVNRLLGFSRMEANKTRATLVFAPVAAPVLEAVRTVQERNPDSAITHAIDETLEVRLDGEGLKMAVTNLLTNAIKYAEGPYEVRVRAEGGGVRIEVEDRGPGLSRRDQKRIFRPFERADDRLSKATEGSGIGLSLVNHVARNHRGRAGVDSEVGRGSIFFLWLPGEQG